jgi:hypothetical protein
MQPAIRPSPGFTLSQSFWTSATHAFAGLCATAFDPNSNKAALTAKTLFSIFFSHDLPTKLLSPMGHSVIDLNQAKGINPGR